MGDHVSKLKLLSAADGDMEERSFPNRWSDWSPAGDRSPEPGDGGDGEPLDADGDVGH